MSPKVEKIKVKVAGMTVVLPVHEDMDTTAKIVAEVEKRLARIEDESDVVNTQQFAIQAAYEFAAKLHEEECRHREDERDMIKALEQLSSQLKQLVKRFHITMPPSADEEE